MAVKFVAASSQTLNLGVNLDVLRNVAGGTVMIWMRPVNSSANISAVVQDVCSIALGPPPGTSVSSRLSLSMTNIGFRILARALDADAGSSIFAGTWNAREWIHVAAVANFTTAIGRLYINGSLISTQAFTSMTPGNTSNTNSKNGAIGSDDDTTVNYTDGDLEDFRCYNRALGDIEIETIYATRGRDGIWEQLALRCPMNELGENVAVVGCPSIGSLPIVALPVNGPVYTPGLTTSVRDKTRFLQP